MIRHKKQLSKCQCTPPRLEGHCPYLKPDLLCEYPRIEFKLGVILPRDKRATVSPKMHRLQYLYFLLLICACLMH